jgi:hypothetical protein
VQVAARWALYRRIAGVGRHVGEPYDVRCEGRREVRGEKREARGEKSEVRGER